MKAFLAWLDRKFPDKVLVTEASYLALLRRLAVLERDSVVVQERLRKLDVNVEMHNQAMGYSARSGALLER